MCWSCISWLIRTMFVLFFQLRFTFWRGSDFCIHKDRDFTDHGQFIEVVFTKSKNEHYHLKELIACWRNLNGGGVPGRVGEAVF